MFVDSLQFVSSLPKDTCFVERTLNALVQSASCVSICLVDDSIKNPSIRCLDKPPTYNAVLTAVKDKVYINEEIKRVFYQ